MVEPVSVKIRKRASGQSGVIHLGTDEHRPLCRKHGTKYPVLVAASEEQITCQKCRVSIEVRRYMS